MKREHLKIRFSICLLLFIGGFLWLFDGVIGWKRFTFLVALVGGLILCAKKPKISRNSVVWLCYSFAIIMSLILNRAITNWTIYMFLMYSLIIMYAILADCDVSVFKAGVIFLVGTGIFNAVMVMVHFLFKGEFNAAYFPFLKYQGSLDTAEYYYGRGYYFGFNYKPHEVAGLIVFAMAGLLIWGLIQTEYRKKLVYIVAVCMVIPLLLTGKKGVTACFACVAMIMLLIWYASKKQWVKIGGAIGIAAVLLILAICYIVTHLDNPLFYRFAAFFTNLASGQSVDAGRGDLRSAAWQLWTENKLFGVGWFQFNGYTVSRFGFARTHSVNLDYLQFLCETGIFGFALMMTPIIVMLRRTFFVWKNLLKDTVERQEQWILLLAVFIQLYTILYAFIEVPFYDIMYFIVYMFSCMIINNAYKEKRNLAGIFEGFRKNMKAKSSKQIS